MAAVHSQLTLEICGSARRDDIVEDRLSARARHRPDDSGPDASRPSSDQHDLSCQLDHGDPP
jgi:hypothetical protein